LRRRHVANVGRGHERVKIRIKDLDRRQKGICASCKMALCYWLPKKMERR
jgi:hypothetical protein